MSEARLPDDVAREIASPASYTEWGTLHATLARVRREWPFARADLPEYRPFSVASKLADIREVASRNTEFLSGMGGLLTREQLAFEIAFPQLGFSIDCGGTFFLPRVMAERRALEFILGGRRLSAEEAAGAGRVMRVVDDADLHKETSVLAARLASGATRALGAIKRLVRASSAEGLEAHLENESRTLAELVRTRDAREGLAAFAERRPARFEGS